MAEEKEACFECLIAAAVGTVSQICTEHPELPCGDFEEMVKKNASQEEWLQKLNAVHRQATGEAKEKVAAVLRELCREQNTQTCLLWK